MSGALSGIKVLDLTRVLAGPLCTMLLGDLGADILKVESPVGDETRGWGPPHAGGEAAYYLGVNRNKRDIVLDLKTNEGREILGRMMREADVLVENYKTGTLESWGFGADWRAEHAPRLIHCSITGYGPTGPRASDPGYDFILQAETGLMSITGTGSDEPTKHGVAIVDITTGLFATIAVLAGLQARDLTGKGQSVHASLLESGITLLANVASNYLVSGKQPGRYGNGHPNIVPYRTFATADGQLALAVGNDGQFARLAGLAGHPEWAQDERMATNAARVNHRDVVEGLVSAAMATQTNAWWIDELRRCGIPCGKVNDVPAALAEPQAIARDMIMTTDHPLAGMIQLAGFPFKMSETPLTLRHAPPLFGQQSEEILEELGYGADERARLIADGVVRSVRKAEIA